jgi:hypothetical protein
MNTEHEYNKNGFCKFCGWERQFIEKTSRVCTGPQQNAKTGDIHSSPTNEAPSSEAQSIVSQLKTGSLPPLKSAVAMFVLGVIAICIGVYLTPFIAAAGNFVAYNTKNNLTGAGGAIFAVCAPVFPYFLLGGVLACIRPLTRKVVPVVVTAYALAVATGIFHMCSPMLAQMGEQFGSKGLARSPGLWAILYCMGGAVLMHEIAQKFVLRLTKNPQ